MSRKYRLPLVLVFLLTALLMFAAAAGAAPADIRVYQPVETPADTFVPDEILVKFKPAVGSTEIDRINKGLGIAAAHRTYSGVFLLKVPEDKLADMIEIYNRLPMVEYAEPNYIAHTFMTPSDPLYSPFQWHLYNTKYGGINMETAWGIETGSSAVVVAVVDTGVAYETFGNYMQAPDLANANFVPGYDFVNNDSHPNDDNSHGTHVTGTIAQSTNNGLGVAGVAFNTSIMPVKVLNKYGSGTYSAIANGIKWAVDHDADVINLSLGGSSSSITLESALSDAYNKGVTIIAAAGNDGADTVSYPAAYDNYVIAVGATRFDNALSYYSNYGSSLDLVAPGGDVNVDQNGDGYGDGVLQNTFNPSTKNTKDFGYYFFQGTSMATPHVSGVAALLIANGVTGPDNIRNVLQSSAKDLGSAGWDQYYGYGLIDAYDALTYSQPPPTNTAPVAVDDGYVTNEDVALNIATPGVLVNDTDDDEGDGLTSVLVSGPDHGSLTLNSNGYFSYMPALNHNGNDSFTYQAYDNKAYSNIATVTITVNPVNDAPVANSDSYDTNKGITLTVPSPGVLGNDTDIDGNSLTAALESGPSNGALVFNDDGSFSYTPTSGYSGDDSFTYKTNDGGLDSNIATVTITINEATDPTVDTTEPVWPIGSKISAIGITKTSLTLKWSAATDNIGVVAYDIYKDDSYLGSVNGSTLEFRVTGLTTKTSYSFVVKASDQAENVSADLSGTVKTK